MCDANATNAGVLGTSKENRPSGESRKAVALSRLLSSAAPDPRNCVSDAQHLVGERQQSLELMPLVVSAFGR